MNPTFPALAQESVFPSRSVIVTIVLLNVDLMWAWPCATFFFSLRRGFLAFGFANGYLPSGYFVAANPANAFFYLLTALHGLHLLGGLWVWGRTTIKVLRGVEVGKVRLSVELCTVYWHYLLLVWLVLFAVLLHTHTHA